MNKPIAVWSLGAIVMIGLSMAGASARPDHHAQTEAAAAPESVKNAPDDTSVTAGQIDGATRHACPSHDFAEFLRTFADRASTQRQFTKLPLEYGQLHVEALGTATEYTIERIKKFELIPSFDRRYGGAILPGPGPRAADKLALSIEAEKSREDPEYSTERTVRTDRIARLFLDNSGFHIYYRFQKRDGCWFLMAIHDKST